MIDEQGSPHMTPVGVPARAGAIVLENTLIGTGINTALSIAFFLGVFGLHGPIAAARFGPDFFVQAFMVTFMGTVAPCLILRRQTGERVGGIAMRSFGLAIAATLLAGGGGFAVCSALGDAQIPHLQAFVVKAAFGAVLSLIVTPIAVRSALKFRRT
jgi:hypothetical protein